MQAGNRAQDERVLKLMSQRNRSGMDCLIAAHAVSVGLTLVTNNDADFKDYPGLLVENWAQPD